MENIISKNLDDFFTYKTQIIPKDIKYSIQGVNYYQSIHKFNLNNIYAIDRFWAIGSCPHLFFQVDDKLHYKKEILAHCENKTGREIFHIAKNVTSFIIAEIEDEITEIEHILINDKIYQEHIVIKKSELIRVSVSEGDTIEIKGRYVPHYSTSALKVSANKRNQLVGNFLQTTNANLSL
ncbi:hypothetical protein [Thiothrix nivea]|uniref:Uncharacterized protein n=1 Tax=Thiothrix nivea (strain ATCC 35100 / DSM 5205 / JP2) TaxID=870187 RepID=A0A656HLJ8_THINJ|nr:hypothetical protein [Thiothrix nivea]EIJ36994.1 hypothetical protein Thini_4523 [Thiothrix nivea DSM 5205]